MAFSNRDRVQRGLDALREALIPFVERSLRTRLGNAVAALRRAVGEGAAAGLRPVERGLAVAADAAENAPIWDAARLQDRRGDVDEVPVLPADLALRPDTVTR